MDLYFAVLKSWSCNHGQGLNGILIKETKVDHLDACKNECFNHNECKSIDYSDINVNHIKPSCRLFKTSKHEPNEGQDKRVYCEHGENDHDNEIV